MEIRGFRSWDLPSVDSQMHAWLLGKRLDRSRFVPKDHQPSFQEGRNASACRYSGIASSIRSASRAASALAEETGEIVTSGIATELRAVNKIKHPANHLM